ncbi:MAG: 50S ribosomal protein L35 [Candidatus Brocadiia bacterium]
MSEKTHKGLKQRLKVTKTGKIMHARSGRGHLLGKKRSKRKRRLRKWDQLEPCEVKKLKKQYDFSG